MGANAANIRFASIDIGSHTIRLLIAALSEAQEIMPLHLEREITRLARGFQEGGMLTAGSMRDSIEVLKRYRKLLQQNGVQHVVCGATGVIRRAANAGDFLRAVGEATALRVSILSEEAEAFLSAKGVLSALRDPQELILCFDLGGSSTEFLLMHPGQARPFWSASMFIGAATITERHLVNDPPLQSQLNAAVEAVRDALSPVLKQMKNSAHAAAPPPAVPHLVGTAGTATTLAAIHLKMTHYQPYRVNGLRLSQTWIEAITEHLAGLPVAARRGLPGLEPGREDIILGGALITREILRAMEQEQFTVTDAGLLEGLLLSLVEKECGWPQTLSTPLTWHLQKS